jgi:predicted outer membrane repeat protein
MAPAPGLRADQPASLLYRRPLPIEEIQTMFFHSWLRTLRTVLIRHGAEGKPTRARHRQSALFRPRLEVLEDRLAPATFTVPLSNNTDPASVAAENGFALDDAIIAANASPDPTNTIVLPAANYLVVPNNQLGLQPITHDLIISGAGPTVTVIDGVNSFRVFESYNSNVSITGVTIQDAAGALINHGGTLSLSNCILSGNSGVTGVYLDGSRGGSIYSNGNLIIDQCILSGNSATGYGGGIFSVGTLMIAKSTLSGNSATSYGGGIFFGGGTATIDNTTLSGNSASIGGASAFFGGDVTMTGCTVNGNTAYVYGGGIFVDPAVVTVINSTFSGNSAPWGADLYNLDSSVIVISSSVTGIYNNGGAVTNFADLLSQVSALNLSSGVTNSLTSKLQAAEQSLGNANTTAAVNQLDAFVNQIDALVNSRRVGEITADSLVDEVDNLVGLIG